MNKEKVNVNYFIYDLVFKYFLPNPLFKICILPIILLIYVSSQLHTYIISAVNEIEKYLSNDVKMNSPQKLIFSYLLFCILHYFVSFLLECVFAIYLQNTVIMSFKIHISEYLKLCHNDFHELGTGKIHSLVERRTKGITDFIELVIMNFLLNFVGIYADLIKMNKDCGRSVTLFNIGVICVYALFCVGIAFEINRRRLVANQSYNECSNRIYGILENYDVIKSYNNDILEIDKLNTKFESVEKSYFYFEMTCNVTKCIQVLIVLIPNSIVMYMAFNKRGFVVLNDFIKFSLYHKLFISIKNGIEKLGREILKFSQTYIDVNDHNLKDKHLDANNSIFNKTDLTRSIEFKDFKLTIGGKLLIEKLNLKILKNEKIAIIGKNGSGKSSLIKTLLRFYDYEGKVYIDDIDIQKISIKSQRNLISYIPQIPYLIEGTILDNLKYSNKHIKDEDIQELCVKFKTHEIFSRLKDGYMTNVGEGGKSLSGGQRQQVSFMRGVIKNADLFLLDEATANLDSHSEKVMIDKVLNELEDKTVLFVIHNFKYLKEFDRIIGFSDGKVNVYDKYEEFLKDAHLY